MTPAAAGRHCAACAKTVVDFTAKTDAEILIYLARAASSQACGRFRVSQLHRPLTPPDAPTRWRAWLGALLTTGSLLGSGRASAQSPAQYANGGSVPLAAQPATAPAPTASAHPAASDTTASPSTHEPPTLHGVVTDTKNGALPGATVLLKGTTQGTSTDANGEFTLPLKDGPSNPVLVISFVGFATHEQPIAIGATGTAAAVQVKLEEYTMGLLISPRPYPWHPRALFSWGKYWLTRPFR